MASMNQLLKDLGAAKSLVIGAGILIIVVILAIIGMKLSSSKNMIILFNHLEVEDANKIISELESKRISYQLKENGTSILVPESEVLRLRMELAGQGIPNHGSIVGYEIFDSSDGLGTSNFVQNVNLVRALEGELSRTISSFNNIESARVHLAMPKKELFNKDKQITTASVIVKMKGNGALSREQVNAITNLIATAVPNLDASKITIADSKGRALRLGARDENDASGMASGAEEYRVNFENRLKNTIEDLLEKSIGSGKVSAKVSADINFDRVVINSEIYDPDGQVVRSVQAVEEKESSTEKSGGNNVSVANNIPDGTEGSSSSPEVASNVQRTDETTNYEISKTVKNHISETGVVKRLSIAILVDGLYIADPKTGEVSYKPRSEEELKKYESLIKSAVGFDEARNDKIEIINMQFTNDLASLKEETPKEWLKRELPKLVQTFVVGIVVVLVLLLVVRPIAIQAFEMSRSDINDLDSVKKVTDTINAKTQQASQEAEGEENSPDLIDITRLDAKVKMSSSGIKTVNDLVSKYPQETVNVIRNWLNNS